MECDLTTQQDVVVGKRGGFAARDEGVIVARAILRIVTREKPVGVTTL